MNGFPVNIILLNSSWWNQDSVIEIATRLWAGQSSIRIPEWARDFFLLQNIQTSSKTNSGSYLRGTRFLSTKEKGPVHEVEYLPPSSAKIKNKWS